MSKSPVTDCRVYKDDFSVGYRQPFKSSNQPPLGRPTQQHYPGYEHYPNGSTHNQHTHRGQMISYSQSQTGCCGNPPYTNTLGNTVCFHNIDRSLPALNASNITNPTHGFHSDKQYQPKWTSARDIKTSAEAYSANQQQGFKYGQPYVPKDPGQSTVFGFCQQSQMVMDNSMQMTVKGNTDSVNMTSASDSPEHFDGNLSVSHDYGSCTLTPDYSSDNFQETFMKHISPTAEANAIGCKDSDHLVVNMTGSETEQDVIGADWPYLVPQFDDLCTSGYESSAPCKTARLSWPECKQKSCDKDSDDASIHLDYSQLYSAEYYQLTYCDSDSQKDRQNHSNCVQDHNAHIQTRHSFKENHNGCIQSQTAETHKDRQSNKGSNDGQRRQVSIDSNKSMVSDYDGHDDMTQLIPKPRQKTETHCSSNKSQQKSTKPISPDGTSNQGDSTTMKPTLLTSKNCGIKFHSLEIKAEDIVEAHKKNQLYASNLGEKLEDIWMCDSIKSPEEGVQSDKEETCEGSPEIMPDQESFGHKVRDIDFWDYDNSSSNSNYLSYPDTNNHSIKVFSQSQRDIFSEESEKYHNDHGKDSEHKYNSVDTHSISQENGPIDQPSTVTKSVIVKHGNETTKENSEGLQCLLLDDRGPIRSSSKKTPRWAANIECSPKEEITNSIQVKVEIHPQNINNDSGENQIEEKQDKEKGEKETKQTHLEKTDGETVIEGKDPHVLFEGKSTGDKNSEAEGATDKSVIDSQEGTPENTVDKTAVEATPRDQLGKHLEKQASDASRSSGNTSVSTTARGKSQKQLQKVVYYQNRFITVPIDPNSCKGRSISKEKLRSSNGSVESKKSSAVNQTAADEKCVNGGKATSAKTKLESAAKCKKRDSQQKELQQQQSKLSSKETETQQLNGDMNPIELENSIISMHSGPEDKEELDGRNDKRSGTFSKADAVFNKIKEILQDKRCDDEIAQNSQAKRHSTNPILKKILNIIFIAIGVILLLGVVIVIIYTTIGKL